MEYIWRRFLGAFWSIFRQKFVKNCKKCFFWGSKKSEKRNVKFLDFEYFRKKDRSFRVDIKF